MASESANGSTTDYTRGNGGRLVGERIGTVNYYYLFDGLGSVVAVTDGSGSVVDTYDYSAYGKVTPGSGNSVANPWQFAGGYYDSTTGLVKFGQRYYDPSTGRWTQRDPIPQGNRYVYAGDNPINSTDPTGTLFGISSQCLVAFGKSVGSGITAGVAVGGAIAQGGVDPLADIVAFGTTATFLSNYADQQSKC